MIWLWIGFIVFVLLMLWLDLAVLNRGAHVISVKKALIWSGFCVVLALIFSVHYFLWGRNFSAEIAAERERLRRQDAREAGRPTAALPADAIQDLSRTQGIQER